MSKAFTSEENEDVDLDIEPGVPLPEGMKNYMTPAGAKRLEEDIHRLIDTERPHLIALKGQNVDSERRLAALDRRIRFLNQRLEQLEIIDPSAQPIDRVQFGATVTVQDAQGESGTYRIVGIDEVDLEKGWISFISPLAAALLQTHIGETVSFVVGREKRRLTVNAIRYE